jgi:pimeloyl-ACP methyl ester carboxylesterase
MQTISSFDGTNVAYRYMPGKLKYPTLVFLHGVGGNWTVWKKELIAFEKKGYPTLAIDLRGHGESDSPLPFEKYKHTSFVRDVYEILKKEKIKNFSLIGHSLGGGVVITYCSKYKKRFPSSIVFVETPTTYPFNHDKI